MAESVRLTPIRRPRTHEEVVRKIQEEIYAGRLKPGDRLPAERELSEQLGVSRASVREGIRVLEALEVVDVRQGPGPDSGLIVLSEPGEALAGLLRMQLALSHFSLDNVVDLRIVLEGAAARRAAESRTEPQLVELKELLDAMESEQLSRVEFNELDTQFHVTVTACGGNPLTRHFMHALRDAIAQHMLAGFERVDDWEATAAGLRHQHRQLLNAIASQDPDAAEEAVRRHIEGFYREMQ